MRNEKQILDIRHLMIDDWVMYQGEPRQIRSVAGRVVLDGVEEGEVQRAKILPCVVTPSDLQEIAKRIRKYEGYVLTCRQPREDARIKAPIVDISHQENGSMKYISLPILYYHELQHALLLIGCPMNISYFWSHKDTEEKGDE